MPLTRGEMGALAARIANTLPDGRKFRDVPGSMIVEHMIAKGILSPDAEGGYEVPIPSMLAYLDEAYPEPDC